MSEIGGRNEEEIEEKARQEKLFHEYHQAIQIAQHSDTIIYEVTAIVWGANTLLLGFILEVPCESSNQNLVMLSAVVGFCLSAYVPVVYWLVKLGQKIAQDKSEAIEADLKLEHRIHTLIRGKYPKWHPGKVAMGVLTLLFLVTWAWVFVNAWRCTCQRHTASPTWNFRAD
jgi:hypothetical protein